MAVFVGVNQSNAVDRLVPSVFATIDAAEAASSPGDRIIVSPGTYTTPANGLIIDVANLQLLSTGGFANTTISNNTVDKPVIRIAAPGVIIGDVGAGFTIEQLTPGPGSVAHVGEVPVWVDATQVKFSNPVRIQYNRLSGNQNDEGILVDPYIEAGSMIIQQNSFVKNGGTFAFKDAMHFHYADHPSNDVGNVSLFSAAVDILNNNGTEIDRAAIYFHYDIYHSRVNIDGNNFTGNANTDEGVNIAETVDNFSEVNITNNTFATVDYPIYAYAVDSHSSITIANNTVTDYRNYGIEVDYTEYNSTCSITGNTVTGNGTADYGIYAYADYVSQVTISNNNITGWDTYGIYLDYCEDGSTATISDNTISSSTQGDYGIYCETEYGSSTVITGNTISGFDYAGIYEDYPYSGSSTTISNNTLTADNSGADYGIYFYGPEYGCEVFCTNNTVTNFDTYGIYNEYTEAGSHVEITGNTLTALPAGADYGIYNNSEVYEGSDMIITGNTVSGFDYAGVYISDCYYLSSVVINDNTLNAISAGADYGVYMYEDEEGSHGEVNNNTCTNFDYAGVYYEYLSYESFGSNISTINGNTLNGLSSGADYGIYIDYVEYGATGQCNDNNASNFDQYGLYAYEIDYGGDLTVSNNTFTANSSGCDYGMYTYEIEYGGALHLLNNIFSGFGNQGGGEYGYECYYIYEGGILDVLNNTFTAHDNGADYGFYSDDGLEYGSTANINNNSFTGFKDTGVYLYYVYEGCHLSLANNVIEAHSSNADYGVYLDDGPEYGSTCNISSNTISGFTEEGIHNYYTYEGCRMSINYNNITGADAGAYYGIYQEDYVDYGSYWEAIGNSIGNIKGNPVDDSAGIYFAEYVDDGSEAVVCDNFIRALAGQAGDFMAGIYFYYCAEYGSKVTVCNNNIAGFEDAQIAFYDDFQYGPEVDITGNTLNGGHYGIINFDDYNVGDGTIMSISRNNISGFDTDGIRFGEVWGSQLSITENKITGNNSENGIIITDADANEDGVNSASTVNMAHNCISSVQDGIEIETVLDTATVHINQNDFDGVTNTAIRNVSGDAAHTIDGEQNFFGAVPTKSSGNVDVDPELATNPDADGDGVPDCDDQCFDTAAGDQADATGCSCIQLNPTGDADGDGTIDCDDGCPNDPNKTDPGACGCGVADTDADADGIADCNDGCVNGSGPDCGCGFCGMGTASMMPFAILGLMTLSRRRWKKPVRR